MPAWPVAVNFAGAASVASAFAPFAASDCRAAVISARSLSDSLSLFVDTVSCLRAYMRMMS